MESVRIAAMSRKSEPETPREWPCRACVWLLVSVARPTGSTAITGRLRVCRMLDPAGGVFGVLVPPEPGTLFRVPARIRGLDPAAVEPNKAGIGDWRSEAAESEGRKERGIDFALMSLDI
jgi:hypothetical protein